MQRHIIQVHACTHVPTYTYITCIYALYTNGQRDRDTQTGTQNTDRGKHTNTQDAQYDNSLHIRSYIIETGATILY